MPPVGAEIMFTNKLEANLSLGWTYYTIFDTSDEGSKTGGQKCTISSLTINSAVNAEQIW